MRPLTLAGSLGLALGLFLGCATFAASPLARERGRGVDGLDDAVDRHITYKPSRQYMPKLDGFTPRRYIGTPQRSALPVQLQVGNGALGLQPGRPTR